MNHNGEGEALSHEVDGCGDEINACGSVARSEGGVEGQKGLSRTPAFTFGLAIRSPCLQTRQSPSEKNWISRYTAWYEEVVVDKEEGNVNTTFSVSI